LGVNAVELLPIHQFFTNDFLASKNLKEYWGYNSVGYFAPHFSYGTNQYPGCQVHEFKQLVRELHKAGIEVILDVVFNHTGEGNHLQPAVCFKGLDNSSFYALKGGAEDPYRFYRDEHTGCGNTLNFESEIVRAMTLDSLRYWVQEMHVDGFRFDLAPALFLHHNAFQAKAPLFDAINQDPILQNTKLIAEPWDLRTYAVGAFPQRWMEWNDQFRDTIRKFIQSHDNQQWPFALRMSGSRDLIKNKEKQSHFSINFITSHDGFTLNDLFSYNRRHNEANLEENDHGIVRGHSHNHGVEGETDDQSVNDLRKKLIKNSLCCLFLSLGVPMMLGGDEFCRTQQGNDNAYCQDNDITWFNWEFVHKHKDILQFTKNIIALRRRYPQLRHRNIIDKHSDSFIHQAQRQWFNRQGHAIDDGGDEKCACLFIKSEPRWYRTAPSFFCIFNSAAEHKTINLPASNHKKWYQLIDTAQPEKKDLLFPEESPLLSSGSIEIQPQSVIVLFSGEKS